MSIIETKPKALQAKTLKPASVQFMETGAHIMDRYRVREDENASLFGDLKALVLHEAIKSAELFVHWCGQLEDRVYGVKADRKEPIPALWMEHKSRIKSALALEIEGWEELSLPKLKEAIKKARQAATAEENAEELAEYREALEAEGFSAEDADNALVLSVGEDDHRVLIPEIRELIEAVGRLNADNQRIIYVEVQPLISAMLIEKAA